MTFVKLYDVSFLTIYLNYTFLFNGLIKIIIYYNNNMIILVFE
jgi:hypothetical protein